MSENIGKAVQKAVSLLCSVDGCTNHIWESATIFCFRHLWKDGRYDREGNIVYDLGDSHHGGQY